MHDLLSKTAKRLRSVLLGAALTTLALLLLQFNYALPPWADAAIQAMCYGLIALFVVQTGLFFALKGRMVLQSPELIVRIVVLGGLAITHGQPRFGAGLVILERLIRSSQMFLKKDIVQKFFDRLRTQPALLLASSFAVVIALGSALLSLPIATVGRRIHFLDAVFTATSATCVTGLTVQDTGTYFTAFGQGVILALVQIGGLGIMTMSTSLALIMGRKLSIRERLFIQNVLEESDYGEFARILKNIVKMTLWIEGVGAAVLTARWYLDFRDFGKALYMGVFHAVSAFCNAGFSLMGDSLVAYQFDPTINLTIGLLIIAGGLGFAVIYGLYGLWGMPKPRHLNLHLKMTLTVTAVLLLGGATFIFLTEYSNSLLGMSLGDKLWVSWFQSVTLRTAGFNTIDLAKFSTPTLCLCMVWMFIGGSPGSAAGGVKTTTIGILIVTVRSMLLGRENVEAFGRQIPWDIVRKSISITFIAFAILASGTIALALAEPFPLEEVLFEAVSAMGTVGLSLGVTPKLTAFGKIAITLLMYIGRIGPLTVAFLIGTGGTVRGYKMPTGKIVVG